MLTPPTRRPTGRAHRRTKRPISRTLRPPSQLLTLEVLRRPLEFTQYTAKTFRAACERLGIKQSMGRVGSALDNAVIESWHSTLEFELRALERFATKAQARARVAAWIDEYNRDRKHSSVGMRSPIDYERDLRADAEQLDQTAAA